MVYKRYCFYINDDYAYDAAGSLVSDKNKGITSITYNYLGLVQTVAVSNSNGQGGTTQAGTVTCTMRRAASGGRPW